MRSVLLVPILVSSFTLPACLDDSADPTSTGAVEQAIHDDDLPPNIPAVLTPAADQHLAFALDATGVQMYSCSAAGAWVFVAPDAQLFKDHHHHAVGHHYAGPTWEYQDGSTVVGTKVAAATVDTASIPWLLLTAASHNAIDGKMTDITTIQRLSTNGGLAPAGVCNPGDSANVPYTATYYFYRTHVPHHCGD